MFSKKCDTKTKEPLEEWEWVEGYKGTDKNMKCRNDFQYEIGKQYDCEGNIEECENGFHLCLDLNDTFNFYSVGNGNRYFKVKALVRKIDKDNYNSHPVDHRGIMYPFPTKYRKLVAKSIVFISEVERDEIIEKCGYPVLVDAPDKYKDMALETNPKTARDMYYDDTLIADGYSETFAKYIVDQGKFYIAHSVGTQTDLSMDMKVYCIFRKG